MIGFNQIRKKLYKEVYSKHSTTSKIAKFMVYQPINNWGKNTYLKLKYYFIIEIASFIAFVSLKFKIHPNSLSILNIFLAFTALILLSSLNDNLNYLALIIFFSKNILDYVDGFVARNSKKKSVTGAFLDEWSGIIFYFCFYFSLPIYVYQKTSNVFFLYISIILVFLNLINPKVFILSHKFLNSIDDNSKNKILEIFNSLKSIRNKKKEGYKNKIIKFISSLEYSGGTRYTDLLILIILIEIQLNKILLTPYFCYLWSILALTKLIFFTRKIIRNLK
jgi:hypothetical protein